MKKKTKVIIIWAVLMLLALTGCASTSIEVTKPDGTVIKGRAIAILGAEQKGIDLTKQGDDWLFEMEQQASEDDFLQWIFEMGVAAGRAK